MPESMAHAEPTEAIRRSSHEEAFLYDFGLPSIDNTEQKHQKQESKHADTPLKPKTPIQKSSRDQLFDDPGFLALKITIFPAERENLALELEFLRLKQSQPSTTPKSQSADLGTSASASVARKKRHVDWPQYFCSGTSTSVDAGYLAMIKTYEPETFKFVLSQIELLMLKGISYTWSSVRSFHANIKKQVELYRQEWNDAADICDRASTFF